MRSNWLAHALTNWMGDDAWIMSMHTDVRMFNFHGDTTIITGSVADKRIEGIHHVVDLDLRGTNQREEITCVVRATVILPSKARGPVILPTPHMDLAERGANMMVDAAERIRERSK
jgi:hypothetical protein